MIGKCRWDGKLGLHWRAEKKDDPPRVLGSTEETTEDRQDDAQANCQSRQGVGQVSRIVLGLLPQPRRFRPAQDLCSGIALEPATQKRRGHRPGVWQAATHSTA